MNLSIPQDAFSDGQVRSKLWLADKLNNWAPLHIDTKATYTLNWYGSWVGVGPFLLLSNTILTFTEITLLELDEQFLTSSKFVLDYWHCLNIPINLIAADMNEYTPPFANTAQIFVNTSCEHINGKRWLENIPKGSIVVLQSTNMKHDEHLNSEETLQSFASSVQNYITIFEKAQLDFSYLTKSFSRFMIFGKR